MKAWTVVLNAVEEVILADSIDVSSAGVRFLNDANKIVGVVYPAPGLMVFESSNDQGHTEEEEDEVEDDDEDEETEILPPTPDPFPRKHPEQVTG